jgi:hypothetical protein
MTWSGSTIFQDNIINSAIIGGVVVGTRPIWYKEEEFYQTPPLILLTS